MTNIALFINILYLMRLSGETVHNNTIPKHNAVFCGQKFNIRSHQLTSDVTITLYHSVISHPSNGSLLLCKLQFHWLIEFLFYKYILRVKHSVIN